MGRRLTNGMKESLKIFGLKKNCVAHVKAGRPSFQGVMF